AVAAGIIAADSAAAARREPVPTRRQAFPLLAAHAAAAARQAAPARTLHRLTIDAGLQRQLETLAAEHARLLPAGVSVALLLADHQTGEVLAAVGSAGLLGADRGGFIDMTRALRSPGSTLKPLIYGLAFEQGLAHPESLIEDRPSGFGGYAPENFDRGYQGTVTVRQALQQSLNVPAVTLLELVGPVRLLARMRRAGADPRLPRAATVGLAVGLGGVGVTLRDLVAIYAAIARGGGPVVLRESRDLPVPPSAGAPVLAPRAAWQVGAILAGVAGGSIGHASGPGVPGAIAMKTGTSYGYRDAWAIGFDGRHVVGAWAGRPDAAAVPGLTGRAVAVPLLRDAFARLAASGRPPAPLPGPPPGVLLARTGELPPTLQRVRTGGSTGGSTGTVADPVEIAYPPAGARLALPLASASAAPALVLKVRNGQPPFIWFADGRPIARERFARSTSWWPDGPGYTNLAVIDGRGDASRVTVFIEAALP
ncbi:MAG: penicillin-binding protein 1C, partial [Chromatiaceae bacterium]